MKILLIQLKRIGDLILTTPAIAALREKFPDAKITLVIAPECKALAPAIAGVNKLLVMPRGLSGFRAIAAIGRGKFDYCVDFTRNDRSALLVLLSRARKRIVSFRIKVRSKFWNAQRWAEVINHAATNHDVDLVLTGGSLPLEQAHISDIKSKVDHEIVDLSGKTDLLTLATLIARAHLLITVDSAPMHLASASRTPRVILFGPTYPFHWRARESPALILQGTSTSPFTEFVPKQPRLPMNQISTQAVIDAMETLLSAPATSPRL